MKADKLKLVIKNVLNTPDGYLFVKHLIEESGCYDRAVSFDNLKNYYISGRKGYGEYILELVRTCDFNSYIKLQRERENSENEISKSKKEEK